MQVYWEHSASGLQQEVFDTDVEDEDYVKQKPQI